MSTHALQPETDLVEQVQFEPKDTHGLRFAITGLVNSRRQFAVAFGSDGGALLSLPKVGNRSPAHPQPTPPVEIALAVAA